jgi:NAD(P)-dependent dehydrogenase (short-subunit alcohol dehydrogenase family)
MVERAGGRVITVISDAGRTSEAHLVVSSGAKAGAAGFIRGLVQAVGPYGVPPTAWRSARSAPRPRRRRSATRSSRSGSSGRTRWRRFGEPIDAASMIAFLASDAAGWVTGPTIRVNGGYSLAT